LTWRVVGFYTDDKGRVRPISRRIGRRRQRRILNSYLRRRRSELQPTLKVEWARRSSRFVYDDTTAEKADRTPPNMDRLLVVKTKAGKRLEIVLPQYKAPGGTFKVRVDGKEYNAVLQRWPDYGPGIYIRDIEAYAKIGEEDYARIKNRIERLPPKPDQGFEELKKRLPRMPSFHTTGNEKKFKELKSQADAIIFFEGPEMEGVNLAQAKKKEEIMRQARRHCPHEIETSYLYGYTADGRKKVTRIVRCKKCGLVHTDEVSAELGDEAIWR